MSIILEINPLSGLWFANMSSLSIGCLFTLLTVSFSVQKLFSLRQSRLSGFAFVACALCIHQEHTMESGQLFNKWCWENWISTSKRMKLDPHFTPHIKINSKWIKELNVRPEPVKLLEENIGRNLHDIGFGSEFIEMTPKHKQQKAFVFIWCEVGVQFWFYVDAQLSKQHLLKEPYSPSLLCEAL